MGYFHKFLNRFREYALLKLQSKSEDYQYRIHNNLNNLFKHIRKGDVVLVEGGAQVSRIIKLLSTSRWSHVAMYVGDELIKPHREDREKYLQLFGDDAHHLIIEAFSGTGVTAAPLRKYLDSNIRICRPFGISPGDLHQVIDEVMSNLGKKYDQQNIIDLAFFLLPNWLNFSKKRDVNVCLGDCTEFKVICSGMIARAFQNVGYPISPRLNSGAASKSAMVKSPYGAKLIMRHYSQIIPSDFDLSPNFDVIKFNIIAEGDFDYKHLPWEKIAEKNETKPSNGSA